MAAAGAPHDAGHTAAAPLMTMLERIEQGILDPPIHDVDRFQPVERSQPQPPFPHHEIGPFDEVVAEPGGQVAVLDVGGAPTR